MAFKLMTVDDSRTIRRIVSSYAKDLAPNVEIIEAANGQECIDKCKEELPDLIILDVNMPVMGGAECLEILRETEETNSIPVVMLTTESEKALVVQLLQLGVHQYIIKPFEKQEFLQKVSAVISKIGNSSGTGKSKKLIPPESDYVIVLENKENITKMIEEAFAGNAEVVGTDMAADAITLFTQKAPKLVMANVAAEGLDAFKMFVQMKKVPDRGGVRFLGMCLKTAKDLINQCRGTGYIEVVTKPFTADYIKSTFVTVAAEEVVTEMKGDIYVIQCNSHNFRKAISSILREVDTAAEEGYLKVMFNLTAIPDNELDDLTLWGTIAEKTNSLGLSTSFLSQSPEIVEKLKGLVDTQDLIVTTDEGEAFEALAA